MRNRHRTFATVDPFGAIRREFERQMTSSRKGNCENGSCKTTVEHRHSGNALGQLTITKTKTGASIAVDTPGIPDEDISVVVHDGQLVIEGERLAAVSESAETVYSDQSFGKFRRVLNLDDSIDPESIDAVSKNGVLTITLTSRPEVQPKRVTIRAAQ